MHVLVQFVANLPALGCNRAPAAAPRVSALFGFGGGKREKSEKELEKEEAYRVQQEVLARRRNNSWQKVGPRVGKRTGVSGCPLSIHAVVSSTRAASKQRTEGSRHVPRERSVAAFTP